mgnify:CR=1 FL=1
MAIHVRRRWYAQDLLAVANSPVHPFSSDTLTVIRNAGQPNMEIMVKNHEKLETLSVTGQDR